MGLFDDWQAQKDSQYILAVDYLEQLAKQHDSTIEATASYLMLTKDMKIYERLSTGEYVEPYHDFNNPPPIIEFFDNAKAVYRANGEFTQFFYFETGSLYFKKSELPAIEQVATSESQNYSKKVIDEFLIQTDIVNIIGKYVELKPSGNEFKGCCPFHREKTPSFFVNPQKGLYNCFGCGSAGNALTFLKEYKNLSTGEALKELSKQTGIELPNQDNKIKQKTEPYQGKRKTFNSLASLTTAYNLPQVTALILGISFEYIYTAQGSAQINENEFPPDLCIQFDKLLASLVATAKSGHFHGFKIANYEKKYFDFSHPNDPNKTIKELDYINSVIDKDSLEKYLQSIGLDLKQLLELQEPLTIATPQTDSQLSQQVGGQQPTIESQAKEIADLKVQLATANGTITQQAERISELETKLNELQKPANDNDVLSDRSRTGHLITIALLVDIIKTTPQGFDKRGNPLPPKYASQNKLYEKIEEYGVKGQSAKTLETRFADANKELKDIKPDHKFT